MNYQGYFEKLSNRYYKYLAFRLDKQISQASDKEYAALNFFCAPDFQDLEILITDPFEKDIFGLFAHYYKLNPSTAVIKLVEELDELHDSHKRKASEFPKTIANKFVMVKKTNGSWFERLIGKFNYVNEKDYGKYTTDLLEKYSIKDCIKFVIGIYVPMEVKIYAKQKYTFINGLEEKIHLIINRFGPTDSKENLSLASENDNKYSVTPKWNISQRATADALYQLTNLQIGSKPVLDISGKEFNVLLRFFDPRFRNSSDETINDYKKPDKHKLVKNKLSITISP